MLYHHAPAISINQCPYYLMLETPAKNKIKTYTFLVWEGKITTWYLCRSRLFNWLVGAMILILWVITNKLICKWLLVNFDLQMNRNALDLQLCMYFFLSWKRIRIENIFSLFILLVMFNLNLIIYRGRIRGVGSCKKFFDIQVIINSNKLSY
jgi:hypothetical protein